ncbi:MAG: LysR family transcriptional regulator [Alphaproteobacteria bacterium]|nr:LysR family transcriptional regulator [Alphaproteobacteria bacterium]
MNLDHYQAFLQVAEQGSITAAAKALGVSRPTLSRQLSALEEDLGLALLHRSTRSLSLTPSGRRLLEQLRPVLEALEGIEASLQEERDEATGLLRVSAPPVLAPALAPLFVELTREHPALRLELQATIQWAELRSDGVEVAIRAGRVRDPALICRRLGASEVQAVAAPAYLERHGTPTSLAELEDHVLLRGHQPDGQPQRWWPLREGGGHPVDGAFSSNDQRALLAAALAGGGVALLSDASAGEALADGRLVRVLPQSLGSSLALHVVYAQRKLQPARVRVFVEALIRWFDTQPRASWLS